MKLGPEIRNLTSSSKQIIKVGVKQELEREGRLNSFLPPPPPQKKKIEGNLIEDLTVCTISSTRCNNGFVKFTPRKYVTNTEEKIYGKDSKCHICIPKNWGGGGGVND